MPRIFDGVAGNSPKLNRFDLSYTNTTSMAFGYLYPVQCDEVYPGDVFKMSCFCHAEVMPMVAPIMSDIQLFAHVFFVPFRLLYGFDAEDGQPIWEKFITGGKEGDYETPLPAWVPSFSIEGFSSKTIWDCIGNPVYRHKYGTGTVEDPFVYKWEPLVPPSRVTGDLIHGTVYQGLDVSIAPKYGYWAIYNNFYRDENMIDEVDHDTETLAKVAFKKDYFTSALFDQQRGTAPALPVDVNFAFGDGSVMGRLYDSQVAISGNPGLSVYKAGGTGIDPSALDVNTSTGVISAPTDPELLWDRFTVNRGSLSGTVGSSGEIVLKRTASGFDYSSSWDSAVKATTFTVSDLRLAFAIQRMQELSMRAGYRYTEWLSAHFNAHPTDSRLDRPEYIGGAVINVAISPVVQSSGTQKDDGSQKTPQGNKAGVGRVDAIQRLGNYRVLEHGLIMTLVSIRPKPIYSQGINRQWLRQSRWDFYAPELAWLSEFGIFNAELYVDGTSGAGNDDDIFGYQAAWNEMRCKNNMVTGAVRDQLNYWTLDRHFNSRPALNQDFIEIDENDFNKIFVVQDEDPFVVSWSNIIDAYRPIPSMGVPGLIDHVYGGM